MSLIPGMDPQPEGVGGGAIAPAVAVECQLGDAKQEHRRLTCPSLVARREASEQALEILRPVAGRDDEGPGLLVE